MGMSIDEEQAIEILSDIRMNVNYKCNTETQTGMACKIAIDTMRKYQKIQEIVKQKDYDRFNSHNYYGDFLRVQDIRKVLEDGNDTTNTGSN